MKFTAPTAHNQADWARQIRAKLAVIGRSWNPGDITIEGFIDLTFKHAATCKINADVVMAQFMIEKSWSMGGDGSHVPWTSRNPGNLGVTGPGVPGEQFSSWSTGILASIQHLCYYAGIDPPPPIVDPRAWIRDSGYFGIVSNVEDLGGKNSAGQVLWAADPEYGDNIVIIINQFPSTGDPTTIPPAQPYVPPSDFSPKSYLLSIGHLNSTGATTYSGYQERDWNQELVGKIAASLKARGQNVTVFGYNLYDYLYKNGVTSQLASYDYILEVHFNASSNHTATGPEIYYYAGGANQKTLATAVYAPLRSFFSPDRGAKPNDDGYYIVNKLGAAGRNVGLIEVCFQDNATDERIYLNNKDAVGEAIADGLLNAFNQPLTLPSSGQTGPPVVVPPPAVIPVPHLEISFTSTMGDTLTLTVEAEPGIVVFLEAGGGSPKGSLIIEGATKDVEVIIESIMGDMMYILDKDFNESGAETTSIELSIDTDFPAPQFSVSN